MLGVTFSVEVVEIEAAIVEEGEIKILPLESVESPDPSPSPKVNGVKL